jgi:dienelactone hydrolase
MARSSLKLASWRGLFPAFATLLVVGGLLAHPAQADDFGSTWLSWKLPAPDGKFEIVVAGEQGSTRTIGVELVVPPSTADSSGDSATQISAEGDQPAIVLLHGVEGATAGRWLHLQQARRLAAAGYQVFLVHYFDGLPYRDLLLYGDDKQLDVAAIRNVVLRDHRCWSLAVAQSLAMIAERPGIDRERMALVGYSLGSFVALAATAEAAARSEIPDIMALVGNWGAKFETTQFTKTFPPTLLLHGEQDEVVPVSEARKTAAAMIAAGVADVRLKTYADESHAILAGPAAIDAQKATIEFLQHHLGKRE